MIPFGRVYDYHEIVQLPGEKLGDTVHRHLITKHNRTLTSSPTLNEMSKIHAELHRADDKPPWQMASTDDRRKSVIVTNLLMLDVVLPDWVYEHSFLSDLRVLERIILSAHLARPGVPFPGHQAGVDNPGKG